MLTLTNYPVYRKEPNDINIFPGFKPIYIDFKREDLPILDIEQAADNRLQVNVAADITGELFAGDFIYIFSQGLSYTYDLTAEVIEINYTTQTQIVIDSDFFEVASGGYTNYKQNYAVEMVLVDPTNFAIDLVGFTLKQGGSNDGQVRFDVSIINDLNKQEFIELQSREMTEGRIKFNVKYRETYQEDDLQAYVEVDNPIIALFATEDFELERFASPFSEPFFYIGYPDSIGFIHSDVNSPGQAVRMSFDQLDINKEPISLDNTLFKFDLGAFGVLLTTDRGEIASIDPLTEYVRINANRVNISEYEPTEYSNEYNIV